MQTNPFGGKQREIPFAVAEKNDGNSANL